MEGYNEQFRLRTKKFAIGVIRFCGSLPNRPAVWILSKQIMRSATSVAANYRAMCLGRSDKEKYAKLCIVVEEADETLFWLEMFIESGIIAEDRTDLLLAEAKELAKVFTAYRAKINTSK